MIIKYLAKGSLRGLDEWADSLTQEQFNDRMAILVGIFMLGVFLLAGYLEAL